MMNRKSILMALKSKEYEFSKLGIRTVGLFGSYARDEQLENSDIDILLDFEHDKETFDNLMAVYDILEEMFKHYKVDVVTRNGLSPYIGPWILNEVNYV